VNRDGKIRLRILVDWSSVEVFAGGGRVTITDQVFPDATSDGVQVFAEGGSVEVEKLDIRRLRSAWTRRR
jgi:fructan beta-fructosidase